MSGIRMFRVVAVVALLAGAGLGRPAKAVDIDWNGTVNSFWSLVDNWNPVFGDPWAIHRVPGDGDVAVLSATTNDQIELGGPTAPINGLVVMNDNDLYTNGFLLSVDDSGSAMTTLSGGNSTITVNPRADDPNAIAFETDNLTIDDYATLHVEGGGKTQVDHQTNIRGGGSAWVYAPFITQDLDLADDPTTVGDGKLSVIGAEASLVVTGTGSHEIGYNGDGWLNIQNEASASIAGTTNVGTTFLGPNHRGQITVILGATLSLGDTWVGGGHGSNYGGNMYLSDAGSTITQTGASTLRLGGPTGKSDGQLTICDGGVYTTGTGLLTILGTGSLDLAECWTGGGTLNAMGDILIDGGKLQKGSTSTLTMANGATLTIQNDGLAEIEGGLDVRDSQTVAITSGGTFTNSGGSVHVYETGTITVDDANLTTNGELGLDGGTLHIYEDGIVSVGHPLVAISGGLVTGSGTIVGPGLANLGGIVAPGDSIGRLRIASGDYLQEVDGTLDIELGGTLPTEFDRLELDFGNVMLDGALVVSLTNGFEPEAGNSFDIIETVAFGQVSGEFDTMDLPEQYDWNVVYGWDYVRLQVLAAYQEGDFDHDGDIDGDDFLAWQAGFGSGDSHADGDADDDGDVDGDDFLLWQRQFGSTSGSGAIAAVPEPTAIALAILVGLIGVVTLRRRQ